MFCFHPSGNVIIQTQALCRLVVVLLIPVLASSVCAQDSSKRAAQIELEKLISLAPEYKIQSFQDKKAEEPAEFVLCKEPVLRWANPLRKTRDGCVLLWTVDGRPAVAMCAYWHSGDKYDHEFQSLYETPLHVSLNGEIKWKPATPGMTYQLIKKAKPPVRSRAARMAQMRAIANRLKGTTGHVKKPKSPLRLMREPLYRYPKKVKDTSIIDGAMFALALGTDPEVLVNLEAREDKDGKAQWYVAFARMSVVAQFVKEDDKVIWKAPWGHPKKIESTYFTWKHDTDPAAQLEESGERIQ